MTADLIRHLRRWARAQNRTVAYVANALARELSKLDKRPDDAGARVMVKCGVETLESALRHCGSRTVRNGKE